MSSSTLIFHVFHDKKVGPHWKVCIWLIYKGNPLYKFKENSNFLDHRILSDLDRWILNIFSICKKHSREFCIYFPDFQSFGDSYANLISISKIGEMLNRVLSHMSTMLADGTFKLEVVVQTALDFYNSSSGEHYSHQNRQQKMFVYR